MITWKVDRSKVYAPFADDIDELFGDDEDNWYVTYGKRTRDEQQALYNKYLAGGPLAAPPGHSAHEGPENDDGDALAVDVTLVRGGHDDWDYKDSSWRRIVNKIHLHPRLHSLDDHGDTDHVEAVNWRIIRAQLSEKKA